MKYISTRGDATRRSFSEILLEGLAPDGGLYLPVEYPQIDDAKLTQLRTTLATQLMDVLLEAQKEKFDVKINTDFLKQYS